MQGAREDEEVQPDNFYNFVSSYFAHNKRRCSRAPDKKEPQREVSIQINPLKNELTILIDQVPYKKYPIASGTPETPSPVGDFKVINKYKNWGSGFGTRWIGLNVPWGTYGIHGTNKPHSIGQDASHGCIRMLNRHIEEIYDLVNVGAKVTILGHVLREPLWDPRRLAKGDSGGDVQLIQSRLKSAGFYKGKCNGRFESLTEQALKAYEKANHLPIDGVVSIHDYISLGLVE
ncbi:L,D-transpeptidase family protein [Paenibacillus agricola]|uniref:L,D-transpeptidase family protein n=1 Tax=Paenibacillus agricola TaxID=2716264 RepID=A0ABX0JGU5_9BACL|nr:L,D-transpeptidase family protein [Paenibacillus agricola]NHN35016.1 L,D-transpeptidase family protein [Paenibacillus agricola]